MANRPEFEWVSSRGRFIGSSGLLFVDQTAADIYFDNYFHTPGNALNRRIAVVCTSWGMSMLYIQQGRRNGGQPWQARATLGGLIDVEDHGIQPPSGNTMVPLTVRAVQAGAPGMHHVNGIMVGGARLPWHRRIAVTRKAKEPLHYHQHEEREGHVPEVIPAIKAQGAHVTMRKLVYGSQVSNYRRAQSKA